MRVSIRHQTRYVYDEAAEFGPHLIRLRPAEHAQAKLLSYNLEVSPACEVRWQYDPWSNRIARATFEVGGGDALVTTVDASFEIRPVNPFDYYVEESCKELPFEYPEALGRELAPFLAGAHAEPGPRLAEWLEKVPPEGDVTDHLVKIVRTVAEDIRYLIRDEPGLQTSEETLEIGSGSCRDSALLLCEALRAQGLAARFVSGYLIQLADEGNIPGEAKGVAQDVVDLHAWCEVYLPGAGWIGLDGTSGLFTGEGHIPLACTVGPALAAPIDGTASRAASGFEFEMRVERLGHEPRPRRPYTDEQWDGLLAAGDAVDAAVREAGLALTMGGEPTWTSREHPGLPEWDTEAQGPTKWLQGLRFVKQLAPRLAPGGLIMHRMGKLYPGESLPRWVLHLLWRPDGSPVWNDPARLDLDVPRKDHHPSADATEAQQDLAVAIAEGIAGELGVEPNLCPGYEDPWLAIIDEMNLPEDVDPLAADLDDPEQRRTLSRVLSRGLGRPVGTALPLAHDGGAWCTDTWTFKRGRMYLLQGDSPMGLRMPLDRLGGTPHPGWVRDVSLLAQAPLGEGWPVITGQPRSAPPRPPQPSTEGLVDAAYEEAAATLPAGAPLTTYAGYVPGGRHISALCVEARQGTMHVFLPPTPSAEAFLELVAAVERVATKLDIRVRLEGYGPPSDPRIESCLITPDPGVLEVNLPPTDSFASYVSTLEKVADAANHAGLCTEKYQLDGREVGSGGGHHLTLGGPSPLQSPFLQRPALMASLLRYVQNHPALSFLFTGLFVGPTSQAPRIDEARHDALDELEIALHRAEAAEAPSPWLTDRLFRNLLVDVAGNTHRTEISIDKLYDPWSPAGRQGILEFRAFEMPPHERMAAAEMLLVRAIVARLARVPYTQPLVRWGRDLHDRFLLPHYLWADMADVLRDLREHGVPLDDAWYLPFLDHRCPVLGQWTADDITVELRAAIEPWPVLGEQPGAHGGTSRYVDASLDRLQVRVMGMTEGRHVVLVNGLTLPLWPTGKGTEAVAGVRFRAWQPPNALHPQIGVHHPVRFDVVDTWGKRSLGACTHHVWHPEGQGFDEPPLTAFEAAARRAQRFTTEGHAPWPVSPAPARPHPGHPYTLDLRRYDLDRHLPHIE